MLGRRSRSARVLAFLGVATVILSMSGCARPASNPSTTQPALGLHSLDETVTVGDWQYRVSVGFEPSTRESVEVMTVNLDYANFSDVTREAPGIEVGAYGADGTPRVEPAGNQSATHEGGTYAPSAGESPVSGRPHAWGHITQPFSVYDGESDLVVTVSSGTGPDIRWLAR